MPPEHVQGSDVSAEGHHFYVRVSASPDGIDVECESVARETADGPAATPGLILDAFHLGKVEEAPRRGIAEWGRLLALALIAALWILAVVRSGHR
jgi:hypothetical protein